MAFLDFLKVKKYVANNDTGIIHSVSSKTCNVHLIVDSTHVTKRGAYSMMDQFGYTFCRRCGKSLSR